MAQAVGGVLTEVAGLDVLGVCFAAVDVCALMQQRPSRLLVLDVDPGDEGYRDAADLLRELNPSGELLFISSLAAGFEPPADLASITIGVVDKADGWDALLAVLQRWWRSRPDHLLDSLPGCGHQLNAIERLSPRERRLLLELGSGQLNKQIAARLDLSLATVESYRKSVAAKLGVGGAELVRLAVLYRCLRWHEPQPASGC